MLIRQPRDVLLGKFESLVVVFRISRYEGGESVSIEKIQMNSIRFSLPMLNIGKEFKQLQM